MSIESPSRFELLSAVHTRDAKEQRPYWTSAAIGKRLGISETQAEQLLRAAEREGLVAEEFDESRHVPDDFNRQLWHLSDEGRAELYRLEDEQRDEEQRQLAERARSREGGGSLS